MNITWKQKLNNWHCGIDLPTYNKNISSQFFFETSSICRDTNCIYEECLVENKYLNFQNEDSSSFSEYLDNPITEYATSFYNLTRTSKLIIPTKIDGVEYTSIKLFIDSASNIQQQCLWKLVAIEAEDMLKKHDKIWISTHGLGVPYLHVRIDTIPKYYHTQRFK